MGPSIRNTKSRRRGHLSSCRASLVHAPHGAEFQRSDSPLRSVKDDYLKNINTHSCRKAISRRRQHQLRAVRRHAHREHLAKVAQETLRAIAGEGDMDQLHRAGTQSYFELFPGSSGCADPHFSSIIGIESLNSETHLSTKISSKDLFPQIIRTRQATAFYPHQSAVLAGMSTSVDFITNQLKASLAMSSSEQISPTPTPFDNSTPPLPDSVSASSTHITFLSMSALTAVQSLQLATSPETVSVGVLNCASPKRPGGAFLAGGNEQEEGIVRRSTLFDSLGMSEAGRVFYASHRAESDGSGLHDHAMLYSPGVIVFKDDSGVDLSSPFQVNVVSTVPVNADTVRSKFSLNVDQAEIEEGIRTVMKERMTRILRLFALRGDKSLVLGAFGVGQFRNSVDVVAEIWAELLGVNGAKFGGCFDRIVFALPGKHRDAFEASFYGRCLESELATEA